MQAPYTHSITCNRQSHETLGIHFYLWHTASGCRFRCQWQQHGAKGDKSGWHSDGLSRFAEGYIRSNDLTFDELNRAALAGLLQRLDFGAELISRKLESVPEPLKGVQMELINPQIACLRPQAYTARETSEVEQHLRKLVETKVQHLILDLRTPSPAGSFGDATAMLSLFVPKGEILYKNAADGAVQSGN